VKNEYTDFDDPADYDHADAGRHQGNGGMSIRYCANSHL